MDRDAATGRLRTRLGAGDIVRCPGNQNARPGAAIRGGRGASSRTRREDAAKITRAGGRRKAEPDFAAVNAAVLACLPALCARWLSDGCRRGNEWIAKNPRREDRRPGSFSVNLATGRWADFALSDARGGDLISLAAYLASLSQVEAARNLTEMLRVAS